MADQFDYVAFAQDFEERNGHPPTAEDLRQAEETYQKFTNRYGTTSEEEVAGDEWVSMTIPANLTWKDRLKRGLSFMFRHFLKVVFLILKSPFLLTSFFFNLIKSTIGMFIVWFVSKLMFCMIIIGIASLLGADSEETIPRWLTAIASPFVKIPASSGMDYLWPNKEIDYTIFIILVFLMAIVMTIGGVKEAELEANKREYYKRKAREG